MRVLLIDNNLFAGSLADEFEKRDCEVVAYESGTDLKIIVNFAKKFKPNLIVLSAGPEDNHGNSVEFVRVFYGKVPIFGVASGMHSIIDAFDGKVDKGLLLHAKASKISHDEKTIFRKLSNPFSAGRYNTYSGSDIPYVFEVSARDENDVVMGVRHKEAFVEGILFHPESLLTPDGGVVIDNLLREVARK
jgi:anthranilate synthase/aminodeoxychorismate synthase-like glutamine amidotransferase